MTLTAETQVPSERSKARVMMTIIRAEAKIARRLAWTGRLSRLPMESTLGSTRRKPRRSAISAIGRSARTRSAVQETPTAGPAILASAMAAPCRLPPTA